ncbi:MAG: hypothetical protein WBP42_00270 [Candidatus Zixiibacteriota bacterium]
MYVYKLDAQSDSVVDSFYVGTNKEIVGISVSTDGRQLWIADTDINKIVNTADMSLLGTISGVGPVLAFFDPDLDKVVGAAYWRQRILYIDPITFTIVDTDSMRGPSRWWEFVQQPQANCLVGVTFRELQSPDTSAGELRYFDYRQRKTIDSVLIEPSPYGGMQAYFEISPDGSRIFAYGGTPEGLFPWRMYDSHSGAILFEALQPSYGDNIFLEDNRRLILTAPGSFTFDNPLTTLQIWDYQSLAMVGNVDLHWKVDDDSVASLLPAVDGIQIPGTKKLYVSAGTVTGRPGAILVISLEFMRIEKAIYAGQNGYFRAVAIGPKVP